MATGIKAAEVQIVHEDVGRILAEAVADYEARSGKTLQPAHVERSILQSYAYRELLLRKGINLAFVQTFPQFARGLALDLCGEVVGAFRNAGEDDEAFRLRVLLAPEAFTTCGSVAAYEFHARSASAEVAAVSVGSPVPGTVRLTVLAKSGMPQASLLEGVRAYVSGERRRPLCDTVEVQAPRQVAFRVSAVLELLADADETATLARATAAVQDLLDARRLKLGADIVPLEFSAALKVAGVYDVRLSEPAARVLSPEEWAVCERLDVSVAPERREG